MKSSQIKRILSGIGYSTDTTVQIPNIRALVMSTNQGIHHHEEFLYFDSANNLINIKKYKYQVISGRLSNLVTVADKFISTKSTLYLRHNYYPFRAPKVRDIIFVIDKDGKIVDGIKTNIVRIGSSFIETKEALPKINKDEYVIVYADPGMFNTSVQDKKTPALFFKYSPVTKNKQDIYLNGAGLLGIEMYSSLPGSV